MQFLVSVIFDSHALATDDEMAAVDVFNDKLLADGHSLFAAGLSWPSAARVVDNRRGDAVVTEGPIADSAEFVAGFWIWDAPDLETALALAIEGSKACNRKLEVRPILGT
jgi:hypothetical protein